VGEGTFLAQILPIVGTLSSGSGEGRLRKVVWVFFDLESTGLDTQSEAIIQV